MSEALFADLSDVLLRRYPEKEVSAQQIIGAIKTALEPAALVNALAEVFRLPPAEMEAALCEAGLEDMMTRWHLSGQAETGAALLSAPLCASEAALRPLDQLFRFYAAPWVGSEIALPEALHQNLRQISRQLAEGMAQDPFVKLYREGAMDYYEAFMRDTAPVLQTELLRLFGEAGPRYLVTTGIGANEQFCHFAAALHNADPCRKLEWILIHSPGQLRLLPPEATVENTLFMEFSRSSVTEETIKLHEYTDRRCKRIVFTNGGGLKKLAERDGNLILRLPDAISGRYGRNKTPILLAPMLVAGMDVSAYWKQIQTAQEAFSLSDPDSLPYVIARFILAFQKSRGTDFLYLGCNDDTLGLLADEFIQFWNEGVNKNGNDLLVSRFFGLPRDSHMNLEGVLGNRQTKLGLFLLRGDLRNSVSHPLVRQELDPIDSGHAGLRLGDEEVILALANYRRFAEVMPSLLLEVVGEPRMEHSAVLGQLFADVTFLYSRMMGIDPGSNPEVKHVRERSAQLLTDFAAELRSGGDMQTLFRKQARA